MAVLLDAARPVEGPADTTGLDDHLAGHRQWAGDRPADPAALRRALSFRPRPHGVLSLEPAGHFTGTGFGPAVLYDAEPDRPAHAVP